MNRAVPFLMAALASLPALATVEHWATTYQVMPDGEDGLQIRAFEFLTYHVEPETEIRAVSEPNHLDQRPNSPTDNANLIAWYGIKVRLVDYRPNSSTGMIVLVDLAGLSTPTNLAKAFPRELIVSNTVECVVRVAKRYRYECGRLEIRIRPPKGGDSANWKRYERVLHFRREE